MKKIRERKMYDFIPKIAGGEKLKITSRVSPPPYAVTIERRITPKRSVFLRMAIIAPEIENAMEPSISINVAKNSIN